MAENGYESLFKPGGLEFALNAVKVSLPEEKQKALIMRLCNIVLLGIEYFRQQNPQPPKQISAFEIAEKLAANEQAKREAIEENPPR